MVIILMIQKIQALEMALEDIKMVSLKIQQVTNSECFSLLAILIQYSFFFFPYFLIVMKFTGLARTCQECKRSENLNMLPIQCLKIEKRKNEKQMMKSGSNLRGLDWETRRQMYHVDLFFLQRQ